MDVVVVVNGRGGGGGGGGGGGCTCAAGQLVYPPVLATAGVSNSRRCMHCAGDDRQLCLDPQGRCGVPPLHMLLVVNDLTGALTSWSSTLRSVFYFVGWLHHLDNGGIVGMCSLLGCKSSWRGGPGALQWLGCKTSRRGGPEALPAGGCTLSPRGLTSSYG